MLESVVAADEILVDGLEPAHVVVGVRDQVDGEGEDEGQDGKQHQAGREENRGAPSIVADASTLGQYQ